MINCSKCGKQIPDGMKYCPACGATVDAQPQNAAPRAAASDVKGLCVLVFIGVILNLAGTMVGNLSVFISGMALVFLPLIVQRESAAVRHFASEGLSLFVVNAVFVVPFQLFKNAIYTIYDNFDWFSVTSSIRNLIVDIFDFLHFGVTVAILVFAILGLVSAIKGSAKPLPLFGKIKFFK